MLELITNAHLQKIESIAKGFQAAIVDNQANTASRFKFFFGLYRGCSQHELYIPMLLRVRYRKNAMVAQIFFPDRSFVASQLVGEMPTTNQIGTPGSNCIAGVILRFSRLQLVQLRSIGLQDGESVGRISG